MPATKKTRSRGQKDKDFLQWKDLANTIELIRQTGKTNLPGTWTPDDANEFNELTLELIERDADSSNLYKPLPVAKEFHECLCHEVGLSGSNQAGKTNAASTEVALAATGKHWVEGKYPKDNVKIACVGNDGRHLSLMYEYLFEKAPYKCFMHPVTGRWTVVMPDDEDHKKYEELWEEAQPIIPPRMVKNVSWISKKEKEPKSVRLHNGTTIRFYSGLVRKMPQGRKFHLVWIDEEIDGAKKWIDELRARIQSLNGRIIWSATPQNATEEFINLMYKAENPQNETLPLSQQTGFFVMLSSDNPYISRVGREAFMHKLQDDDEQMQIRYFGKSARSFMLVYPEFDRARNVIPGPITLRWEDTRFIIIDPGVDPAAVWFVICPALVAPNEHNGLTDAEKNYRVNPGVLVVYDELLIKRANSQLVAESIAGVLKKHNPGHLQQLIIDQKGGRSIRSKEQAADQNLEDLYMEKILAQDVKPRVAGWRYGSSDVKYGQDMVKSMLLPQINTPFVRLLIGSNCKNTIHQFEAQRKKRDSRGNFVGYEEGYDLLDCGRYCTTSELAWTPPPESASLKQMTRTDYRKIMNDLRGGKGLY